MNCFRLERPVSLILDEETYFQIISDKTASLLETCCQIGSLSSSNNGEYHQAMKKFGESIGMAFQIRDDILDYEGTTSLIGKPVGGDIKEKKITLPLIYSLNQVSKSEADSIKKLIKNGGRKEDVQTIIEFVRKNKGIDYALKVAHDYSKTALEMLEVFPDSPSKIALQALADFITDRKN